MYYLFICLKPKKQITNIPVVGGRGEGGTKKYTHCDLSLIAKNIIQTPLQKNERKSVRVYLMLCIIVI